MQRMSWNGGFISANQKYSSYYIRSYCRNPDNVDNGASKQPKCLQNIKIQGVK